MRIGAYVALGASASIPLLHGVHRYGREYMMQYSGMKWYLIELVIYGEGVSLYGVGNVFLGLCLVEPKVG